MKKKFLDGATRSKQRLSLGLKRASESLNPKKAKEERKKDADERAYALDQEELAQFLKESDRLLTPVTSSTLEESAQLHDEEESLGTSRTIELMREEKEREKTNTNRFAALQEEEESLKEIQMKRSERFIQAVTDRKLQGKITIDSGAADSVIPKDALEGVFPLMPKKEGIHFIAANGQRIQNYGRMNVAFNAKGRRGVNFMTFHVTDVHKPLASVSKMFEQGTSVHFSP